MLPNSNNPGKERDTIGLLLRRGFLIEQHGTDYFLSDNAHPDDAKYLSEILQTLNIGYFNRGNVIIIENNPDKVLQLFGPTRQGTIGIGSCNRSQSWANMKRRFCADKIPVRWLEPNIAYYIKALSACGIYTGGCCDGNHVNTFKLYIEFDEPAYKELHKCIWECCLVEAFSVAWEQDFTMVDLSKSRQNQYDQIFLAADFLYHNREKFRQVRMESSSWISKNNRKKINSEIIFSSLLYFTSTFSAHPMGAVQ